ncbi:T9SS type A sorting domain-containing protein [uncultured Algibacter sp.]|uniref:T9SS type A sorting domain-containing protein n=1 Tax=uncultured Algibacter sp. TaxID=298659 RepID=UPI0032168318
MTKKITLLFIFALSAVIVSHAQSLTVLEINGVAPATFFSSTVPPNSLPTNTSVDIKISYTNLSGNFSISMKDPSANSFANSLSTTNPNKNDPNANEITITYTPTTEVVNYDLRIFGTGQLVATLVTFAGISASNSATLSSNDFSENKLTSSFYNAAKGALIINDNVDGDFSIYDITGKAALTGEVSSKIDVQTLNSGLYILTTAKGNLKFAK